MSYLDNTIKVLENIKNGDNQVHAFLRTFDDQAVRDSKKLDEQRATNFPLAGIPVAIKDNFCVKGLETTAGSKMLNGYIPPYTATAVARLQAAGAIVIGKTNMDEFAMGSSTENSAYGPTRNPNDLDRIPGGSSGGSAAAVAAGLVEYALGSDTGGSVRQPAALCGVVGLKPTYGAISRYGLIAMASSLDVVGPITRTVEQAETMFNIMKGSDGFDATVIDDHRSPITDHRGATTTNHDPSPLIGYRIGIPKEYFGEGLDPKVKARVDESIDQLKGLGHQIVKVSLPNTKYALPIYYIIVPVEVSSNMARFDSIRYGQRSDTVKTIFDIYAKSRSQYLGNEVMRRIILGTFSSSAGYADCYYQKAQLARQQLRQDISDVFNQVDVLLTPTYPSVAFKLGEKNSDPLQMYLSDIYTVTANLTGIPAISIPAGKVEVDGSKLPVGLQLMAPHHCEETLFNLGKIIEKFNY